MRELARSVEGGSFKEGEKEVSWRDASGRSFSVVYGGCDHLGFRISRSEPNGVQPSEMKLFKVVVRLAKTQSWGGEHMILGEALEAKNFKRKVSGGKVRYDITGIDYSEMYIESEQTEKSLVVSFGWVRNF